MEGWEGKGVGKVGTEKGQGKGKVLEGRNGVKMAE